MKNKKDDTMKKRQEILKRIIHDLHAGVPVEELQTTFAEIIKDTSADEIAAMENALIKEGFPPEEIRQLCDVHARVFEESLTGAEHPTTVPGHPVHTYLEENREAEKIIKELKKNIKGWRKGQPKKGEHEAFVREYERLNKIVTHYVRKENQLFPLLEAKEFTGPTQVMWGKHDEVRALLKDTEERLERENWDELAEHFTHLTDAIEKLIYLEEKILFPTAIKLLNDREWVEIKLGEPEIGYAWGTPSGLWEASLTERLAAEKESKKPSGEPKFQPAGSIKLSEGLLTTEQIDLMLRKLPVDITFVDENDQVRYYTATDDRLFPRSPAIIGRSVQNCHPPKSIHVVNDILQKFKEKKRDAAEFWIQMNGRFIHIRYFPLYDQDGAYRGVVEMSQDVTGIRELEGERRILDW